MPWINTHRKKEGARRTHTHTRRDTRSHSDNKRKAVQHPCARKSQTVTFIWTNKMVRVILRAREYFYLGVDLIQLRECANLIAFDAMCTVARRWHTSVSNKLNGCNRNETKWCDRQTCLPVFLANFQRLLLYSHSVFFSLSPDVIWWSWFLISSVAQTYW